MTFYLHIFPAYSLSPFATRIVICFSFLFSQQAVEFHHTPRVYFGQENRLFPSLLILLPLFISFILEFHLGFARRSHEFIILVPKVQAVKALQIKALSCNQTQFKQNILIICNMFYHDFKEQSILKLLFSVKTMTDRHCQQGACLFTRQ